MQLDKEKKRDNLNTNAITSCFNRVKGGMTEGTQEKNTNLGVFDKAPALGRDGWDWLGVLASENELL